MGEFNTELTTILEANTKPAKTLRRPKMDEKDLTFLQKVREVRVSVIKGQKVLVVLDQMRSFDKIFNNYTPAMNLYMKKGLISVKTLDKVTADDLEFNIVEMDA